MPLFAFLDLPLIHEYSLIDRVIEPLPLHGNLEYRTGGCR